MSLLMIHKAYMPVYSDPDFSCGTDGTGRDGPTEGSTRGPRGPNKVNCETFEFTEVKSFVFRRKLECLTKEILDVESVNLGST